MEIFKVKWPVYLNSLTQEQKRKTLKKGQKEKGSLMPLWILRTCYVLAAQFTSLETILHLRKNTKLFLVKYINK